MQDTHSTNEFTISFYTDIQGNLGGQKQKKTTFLLCNWPYFSGKMSNPSYQIYMANHPEDVGIEWN